MTHSRARSTLAALAIVALYGAGDLAAQEDMPEMIPEMQAEIAAWMKLAQPGEHHQHLAPFAGK